MLCWQLPWCHSICHLKTPSWTPAAVDLAGTRLATTVGIIASQEIASNMLAKQKSTWEIGHGPNCNLVTRMAGLLRHVRKKKWILGGRNPFGRDLSTVILRDAHFCLRRQTMSWAPGSLLELKVQLAVTNGPWDAMGCREATARCGSSRRSICSARCPNPTSCRGGSQRCHHRTGALPVASTDPGEIQEVASYQVPISQEKGSENV